MQHYLIGESDSNISFAVLKDISLGSKMEEVVKRIALAVKEEFRYETVEAVGEFDTDNMTQGFDCVTEDGDEEIREIKLSLTAIY